MAKWIFNSFIFLLFTLGLLKTEALHAQFFIFEDTPPNLDVSFVRHTIESSARQAVFNTLKIKNNSGRPETFTLNITVPQGWQVLGIDKQEIQLAPYDSTLIPIRVAIGSVVKGDIGYSIIASITDSRGNTVKNEYCYIKIPRKVDLSVKVKDKITYLDPTLKTAETSIEVRNRGNREEPVNFYFDGKNTIGIGRLKQDRFAEDLVIKPYSDSTFTFPLELLIDDVYKRSNYNLELTTRTSDSTYKTNIWLRKLDTHFYNDIPSTDKALVVDFTTQGLLDATRKPTYSATIEGKTLFSGENDIYYYYRNFTSRNEEDLYKYNRMHIGADLGKWKIELGDNYRSFESKTYGRGGYLAYMGQSFQSEILVNRDLRSNVDNAGAMFKYRFQPNLFLQTGGTYSRSQIGFESKLGLLGGGFSIFKKHILNGYIAYNEINELIDGIKKHNEYAANFNYYSKLGKLSNKLIIEYHSPNYYSPQSGRSRIYANSQYQVNNKLRLYFSYNENQVKRNQVQNNITISNNSSISRTGKVDILYQITPNVQVFGAPIVENNFWQGLSYIPDNEFYSSIAYKFSLGTRVKNSAGTVFVIPKFEIAQAQVLHNPFLSLTGYEVGSKNRFKYQYFSLNIRSKYISLLAFYTSGPKSVLDQINYVYFSKQNRRLQIMPAFDGYLYKDVLKGFLGLSYSNDIVAGSSYSNITGQINWYLPNNWEIHALAVYTVQSRTTTSETIEKYTNLYAEAGIRKEFGFQQPRVKYYSIDLIFFKDFNGNHIQDGNEPGTKNILASISRTSNNVKGRIPGDFYTIDLLSDNLGKISIENIPEGEYSIDYNPIGTELGSFSKSLGNLEIRVDHDGEYYIPFVEKNKVFGHIILNRSKLSGLGKVDVSNIRITATDSRGNTYSTLTDKNGEFIIYAPITDEYVVNINNIFYENFDLRQNNFRVQFNGYKQFEVNYVFDEKIRRINFSPSTQDNLAQGITQIRRTNLRGTIKDATSLKPLRARINLVNTKNNSIIASIYSNSQTGDYSLAFLADDNYLIEVLADDYWYYSENLNLNQVTTFMNVTKDILLKQISIGSKIELNIRFDINKAELGPETVAELNRLLRILRDNSNIRIEIQGHCDDLEAINNPQIGEERAKAVAKYLIENGFSNLQVRGFGNTVPVAPNDSEENRALNRRVEIEVISK